MSLVMGEELFSRDMGKALGCTCNFKGERVFVEELHFGQVVQVNVLAFVVDFVQHFLEDDAFFDSEFMEFGGGEHITEDAQGSRKACGVAGRIIIAEVPHSNRIEAPPHPLNSEVDFAGIGGAATSSEEEVLQEVAYAVGLRCFMSGADAHIEGGEGGLQVWHLEGDQSQPIGEEGFTFTHEAALAQTLYLQAPSLSPPSFRLAYSRVAPRVRGRGLSHPLW